MNFQSQLNKEGGIITANRFLFIMGGFPNVIGGGGPSNRQPQEKYKSKGQAFLRTMRYLCDSIDLPGMTINTDARPGYSPVMNTQMPGLIEYGQLSASFICRDYMSEREFFDDWIFGIKNAFTSPGPGATFDNAYMNDITIDATLLVMSAYNTGGDTVLDTKGIRHAVVIRDMYPVSIDPIQLNWSDDSPMKFNINFAYSYWEPIVGQAAFNNDISNVSHVQEPVRRLADLTSKPIVNGIYTPNSNDGTGVKFPFPR